MKMDHPMGYMQNPVHKGFSVSKAPLKGPQTRGSLTAVRFTKLAQQRGSSLNDRQMALSLHGSQLAF